MDLRRAAAIARDRRFVVLLAALALLAVAAQSLQASFGAVDRVTHNAEQERFSERAEYTYAVPVVRNSTHWPNGTVLPMGMPAYYRTISDSVHVAFSWDAAGASGVADATMTMIIRAQTRDGRAYWEVREPLAEARAADAGTGIALAATLDLDTMVNHVARLLRELPPGDGFVNWTVETLVTYAVTADGRAEAGQSVYHFPIEVQDPRIVLPKPADARWSTPHTSTRTWTTENPVGWTGILGDVRGLALAALGVALLGLLAWALWLDPLARLDKNDAEYVAEHDKHREWITTVAGELDVTTFPATMVEVQDLQTLVETAADARCRVLHDARLRVYYAVLPHATYRYARHAAPA